MDSSTSVRDVALAARGLIHVATFELGVYRPGVVLQGARGQVCPQADWLESRQQTPSMSGLTPSLRSGTANDLTTARFVKPRTRSHAISGHG
jgi:hypothetical protein